MTIDPIALAGRRRTRLVLLTTVASLVLATAAAAQGTRSVPVDTGIRWDLFGSLRVRGEAWDWFDDGGLGSYAFAGATARVGVERQSGRQALRLELAAPLLLGLPDDAFVPAPVPGLFGPGAGALGLGGRYYVANRDDRIDGQLFPKQAYWSLTRRQLRATTTLRVGRFEFDDGVETTPGNATLATIKRERLASRLLGTFGWTHVGRSWDGGHWSTKRDGRDVTLMLALPTRGVFQADGWAPLPIAVAYGAWTVPYATRSGSADTRIFGMQYADLRDDAVTIVGNAPAGTLDDEGIAVTSIGGHWAYVHEGRRASADVVLWGVGQLGQWGTESHRAWAGLAEVGLQPRGMPTVNPWLRVGYAHGSGDDDPADGRHGTFFQVLPTPRPYARFPFYNMQNMRDAYASLALRPSLKLTLRGELHLLRLASARDLWYAGGGAFQPQTFGYEGRATAGESALSQLADVSADLRITPDFVISGYVGRASAGRAMRAAYPLRAGGSLAYLEVRRVW